MGSDAVEGAVSAIEGAALSLLESGYQPIPLRPRAKRPFNDRWPEIRLDATTVKSAFTSSSNIGVQNGAPSGNLVDIDVDCPEALALVHLLPPTGMIHGRASAPDSHRWYRVNSTLPPTTQFKTPSDQMLIEFRSTGSQTMVPPSIHPEGEQLVWSGTGIPTEVDGPSLLNAVRNVAAAALIARHWRAGGRHNLAMALSGALLRSGMAEENARLFIEAVVAAAGDEEPDDRLRAFDDTVEKLDGGSPASGFPTLKTLMDEGAARKAFQWLADAGLVVGPVDWQAPVRFSEGKTPDLPARLLPGVFGEFAAALAASTEVPEALPVLSVLATISTAVAKRFVISPFEGWYEPINIYVTVGLPPANSKSLVLKRCTDPLANWEMEQAIALGPSIATAMSNLKTHERFVEKLRREAANEKNPILRAQLFTDVAVEEAKMPVVPVLPQLFANDATLEALAVHVQEQGERFAIISDEGGIIETVSGLYSNGNANVDLILKGIDGGHVRIRRKDRHVDMNPYLTMLLTVQPQVIRNMGGKRAFKGNGVLERFLYAMPHSNLGYRHLSGPPVPDNLVEKYERAIRDLIAIAPPSTRPGETFFVLALSPMALTHWKQFRHEIERGLRPRGKYAEIKAWAGKLAGYTLRLAGLLHVAQHRATNHQIEASTMLRAIVMARRLAVHALAAFAEMGVDPTVEDAKQIAQWLESGRVERFIRSDVVRRFHGWSGGRKRMTEALQVLVDRNFVGEPSKEPSGKSGRPAEIYCVNPLVYEGEEKEEGVKSINSILSRWPLTPIPV